jgi:D-alanyl-D-alanine carboxypeptidase
MNALIWSSLGLSLSVMAWAENVEVCETALRDELSMLCDELGVPGATAAFVLRDGGFGEVAVGLADREKGIPMTPESRMPAASIGKTLVGAVALALEAEGALDIDAPIAQWMGELPWFHRLPAHDKITARHLLTHTSGLLDHVYQTSFREDLSQTWREEVNAFTPEVLISYILDRPGLFPPGEGWAYSDSGYVLLGMVMARATGKEVEEEVEERFLIPCQLTHTLFSDRRDLPGLVPGYTGAENPFGFPVKSTDAQGRMRWHPGVENLGGGWLSTSGDLARWGDALFAGAALPEPARPRLLQTLPTSKNPEASRYGCGGGHTPSGPLGPTWGHGGWIPGYISSLRHYKQYGLTVAFQFNTDVVKAPEDEDWMLDAEIRLARVLLKNRSLPQGNLEDQTTEDTE